MLGALAKITEIVSEKSMEKAIMNTVPEKALSTNLQAYKKGRGLIE
jgi:Pyruvate/2-oxoacid:ferredoxin oxidoreductase gamma subunit